MSNNKFWIVMMVASFDSLKITNQIGEFTTIKTDLGEPDLFCPVFSSKEEATQWSKGRYEIIELTEFASEIYH